jgi:hypothetical protein
VLYPLVLTHFRISHILQWLNFDPSSLHPVQFIISGEMSALKATLHFSAVAFLSSSSLLIVAILASQVAQFNPQQEISFSIFLIIKIFY